MLRYRNSLRIVVRHCSHCSAHHARYEHYLKTFVRCSYNVRIIRCLYNVYIVFMFLKVTNSK